MRPLARVSVFGGAAAIALFAAWLLFARPPAGLIYSLGSLSLAGFALAIAGVSAGIARRRAFDARLRQAWTLIALALLAGSVGDLIWAAYDLVLGRDPFPPSPADLFYLLSYGLLVAGLLRLPYAPLRPEQRQLLTLDVALVMLACGVFLWHFVLAGLVRQGAGGVAGLLTVTYPLGDLLILAVLVGMLQQAVQGVGRRILALLALGISLTIGADLLFALTGGQELPLPAALANLLWLAGRWTVLAAAALQLSQPGPEAAAAETFAPLLRTNLLYVTVLAGMGLAFFALFDLLRADLRLFGTVAGALGLALLVLLRQYLLLRDNRRLQAALARQAITDALTGLANRRRCDEVLAREVSRAERYRRALSVLMLDVDNFKRYNDRHGHLKGDMLLRVIASLLREQLRASDLAARYGGDEFVILLPETNLTRAAAVADKLRAALAAAFGTDEGVTVTIGCAAWEPGMSAEAVLTLADQAMYQVKPAAERA
jgi:diguanylate cyclase (GGDEF)-like protein